MQNIETYNIIMSNCTIHMHILCYFLIIIIYFAQYLVFYYSRREKSLHCLEFCYNVYNLMGLSCRHSSVVLDLVNKQ